MTAKVTYIGGASYTVEGVCFKLGRAVKVSDAALIARLKTTRFFHVQEIPEDAPVTAAPAPKKAVAREEEGSAVKIPTSRKKRVKPLKKSKPAPKKADLDLEQE